VLLQLISSHASHAAVHHRHGRDPSATHGTRLRRMQHASTAAQAQGAELGKRGRRVSMETTLPRPATSVGSVPADKHAEKHHGGVRPLRIPAFHGAYGMEAVTNLSNFRCACARPVPLHACAPHRRPGPLLRRPPLLPPLPAGPICCPSTPRCSWTAAAWRIGRRATHALTCTSRTWPARPAGRWSASGTQWCGAAPACASLRQRAPASGLIGPCRPCSATACASSLPLTSVRRHAAGGRRQAAVRGAQPGAAVHRLLAGVQDAV
jgi:hypothetical protein